MNINMIDLYICIFIRFNSRQNIDQVAIYLDLVSLAHNIYRILCVLFIISSVHLVDTCDVTIRHVAYVVCCSPILEFLYINNDGK